jgi:hypothetical protein
MDMAPRLTGTTVRATRSTDLGAGVGALSSAVEAELSADRKRMAGTWKAVKGGWGNRVRGCYREPVAGWPDPTSGRPARAGAASRSRTVWRDQRAGMLRACATSSRTSTRSRPRRFRPGSAACCSHRHWPQVRSCHGLPSPSSASRPTGRVHARRPGRIDDRARPEVRQELVVAVEPVDHVSFRRARPVAVRRRVVHDVASSVGRSRRAGSLACVPARAPANSEHDRPANRP